MAIQGTKLKRPAVMPESGGFDPILPGVYNIECTKAKLEFSRKGNAMVTWEHTIRAGPGYIGRSYPEWTTLTDNFERDVWDRLDSFLGEGWDAGQAVEIDEVVTHCVGRMARVKLLQETSTDANGKEWINARVDAIKPPAEGQIPFTLATATPPETPQPAAQPSFGDEEPF